MSKDDLHSEKTVDTLQETSRTMMKEIGADIALVFAAQNEGPAVMGGANSNERSTTAAAVRGLVKLLRSTADDLEAKYLRGGRVN